MGLTRGSLEVVLGTGQGLCDEDTLGIVVGRVQLQDHVGEEEEVRAVVDDPEGRLVVEKGCLQGEGHRTEEGKEGGEKLPELSGTGGRDKGIAERERGSGCKCSLQV